MRRKQSYFGKSEVLLRWVWRGCMGALFIYYLGGSFDKSWYEVSMLMCMIVVVSFELLEVGSYTCFMRFQSNDHEKYVIK